MRHHQWVLLVPEQNSTLKESTNKWKYLQQGWSGDNQGEWYLRGCQFHTGRGKGFNLSLDIAWDFFIHKAQRILTETSWFAKKKTDRALIIVKFTVISKHLQKTILHFEYCMAQMQKHNIHTMSQNIMTATFHFAFCSKSRS